MIKKKNQNEIIAILLISVTTALICYYFITFDLLDVKLDKLKTIKIIEKPYEIIIYRVHGNASVQNSIQLRELRNGIEKVLSNYGRYDALVSVNSTNRGLKLLLKNPVAIKSLDTIYVKLP